MLPVQDIIQQATVRHRAGQLAEAEDLYRQALAQDPANAQALHLLGILAHQTGRRGAALRLLSEAVRLMPSDPNFHNDLGAVLGENGRMAEAMMAFREAIRLQPVFAQAHNNLGKALRDTGRYDEALAAFREAIRLKPDHAEAWNDLGALLGGMGRLAESAAACRRALELRLDYAEAHFNLGKTLEEEGRIDEAVAAYESAIRYRPDYADAHWNLALALLLKGDYARGWAEHEWRWRWAGLVPHRRAFAQPQWKGEALAGRTVLLHAEQGFGDTIQFVRYAPLVAARGGRVALECQPELKSLLRDMQGVDQVLARGEPLPAFDLHVPLLSLPLLFGTTLENISAQTPPDGGYLRAGPALAAFWSDRLARDPSRLRVGLAWAGNPLRVGDRDRSLSLSVLEPLARIKGVSLYSLQKGQTGPASPAMGVVDLTDDLGDFAHTAALMANLDLVISVDTAVAHLAGAMGRPVWTLLQSVPSWRWLMGREDSPWYPTMRLFRQPARGDWGSVVNRVAEELAKQAAQKV